MFDDQSAVDAAFADLASLLAERTDVPAGECCIGCGADLAVHASRQANNDASVQYYSCCGVCGVVQGNVGFTDDHFYPARRSNSNYKRIHHWHERVSQLCMHESRIPDDEFLQIARRICDGSYTVINKDVIRQVLRSLKREGGLSMQLYIEKWLQIIQRITGIEPPKPGGQLFAQLDSMFTDLQRPFTSARGEERKNFLNYNYVFCRLFQKLGCPQFSMFFPLIKSRQKLKTLDDMWMEMTEALGWEFTPLQIVPPFAVKLCEPAKLLERIELQVASAAPVEMRSEPEQRVSRMSDLRLLRELHRRKPPKPRRLSQPELVSQKPDSAPKRPRCVSVRRLQLQLLKRPRRQLG